MKLIWTTLAVIASLYGAHAADQITVPDQAGKAYLTDSQDRFWPAMIGYTTDGNGHVYTLNGTLVAGDNITVPPQSGNAYLTDNQSRFWPAMVLYTTDGSGHVIPVTGGGGGSDPYPLPSPSPSGMYVTSTGTGYKLTEPPFFFSSSNTIQDASTSDYVLLGTTTVDATGDRLQVLGHESVDQLDVSGPLNVTTVSATNVFATLIQAAASGGSLSLNYATPNTLVYLNGTKTEQSASVSSPLNFSGGVLSIPSPLPSSLVPDLSSLYCSLSGCTMSGTFNLDGQNIAGVGEIGDNFGNSDLFDMSDGGENDGVPLAPNGLSFNAGGHNIQTDGSGGILFNESPNVGVTAAGQGKFETVYSIGQIYFDNGDFQSDGAGDLWFIEPDTAIQWTSDTDNIFDNGTGTMNVFATSSFYVESPNGVDYTFSNGVLSFTGVANDGITFNSGTSIIDDNSGGILFNPGGAGQAGVDVNGNLFIQTTINFANVPGIINFNNGSLIQEDTSGDLLLHAGEGTVTLSDSAGSSVSTDSSSNVLLSPISGQYVGISSHIAATQANGITTSSCGSGSSVTSGSNDTRGNIHVGSGATACTVVFSSGYPTAPVCVIASTSTTGAGLYISSVATGQFVVAGTVIAGSHFNYQCFQ